MLLDALESLDAPDDDVPPTRRSYDAEALIIQRLGSLAAVPRVAVAPAAIAALRLDQASGFVLAQVDGTTSVEMLIDLVCVVPRVDVLRILGDLAARGVLAFHV